MKIYSHKEVVILDGPGIIYIDFPILLKIGEGSSFARYSSPVFQHFSPVKVYAKLESDSLLNEREVRVGSGLLLQGEQAETSTVTNDHKK